MYAFTDTYVYAACMRTAIKMIDDWALQISCALQRMMKMKLRMTYQEDEDDVEDDDDEDDHDDDNDDDPCFHPW